MTITADDYRALADFRYEIRKFLIVSERIARGAGSSPLIRYNSASEYFSPVRSVILSAPAIAARPSSTRPALPS